MAKIADVIKLKSGYANFVELKPAFEEAQENAERMAMYRPTKSHRQAFERICRGIYQPNDKKFYLLSGSYGTGKSHLCLMTANFLSRSSGDPAIAGFYDNYSKLDPDKGKQLKNSRKDGQYLVAICDYHSGRKFEDVVLKAVLEACQNRGLDFGVVTEFDEAERQLAKWAQEGATSGIRDFYQDFGKALSRVAPSVSTSQLRADLKDYHSSALDHFRAAFSAMMGGLEFQSQSGNLIPILKNLLKNLDFKNRFKGLAIFFDEFGFTLEKAAYSKDVLQGFMESICKNEPNVLFVGCIHKDFKAYADRFSKDDTAVMSARLTQVDLLNEGIEEIIGAIVETDRQTELWNQQIKPRTGLFDQLLPPCRSLNLFPWIEDAQRIRQRVLEDIYGVHPMALACLLRLSSEIGSDARSTFTFFSGDVGGQPGSYADFIQNAEIIAGGGKLNLYTVDRLFGFFNKELSPRNPELRDQQRQFVNGFQASMDALRKAAKGELLELEHDERIDVLHAILIYQLCQMPASLENLQFGLYALSAAEKKRVESQLKDLVKQGAVFFRQQSNTYELAASTGEDPYDLLERYLANPELHPEDPVAALLSEAGSKQDPAFVEARGYNLPFNEDKRFRPRWVQARDLSATLWRELDQARDAARAKAGDSYEGTLVYALCEDEADIHQAREAAKSITGDNLALAVPHAPQPFTELLLRVKACRHYLPPNDAEKISAQTESRLRDLLENASDGYLPALQRRLETIRAGEDACWYGPGGKVLVDRPKQSHQPADLLCEALFRQRCRIKHPDLNFCHDDKWRTGKNTALKQAVASLLEAEQVLIDNGNPDNHGEKRYLEKVLLRGAGALRKIGADGPVNYFACEHDPGKIHDDFPVLKLLCGRLAQLKPGETLAVGAFLSEVRQPPWGAGGTALMLALAHVIRAYGERLVSYKDSTRTTEHPIRGYDDLSGVVADPPSKVVVEVRHLSDAQSQWIDRMAKAVGAPPLKHGEPRTLTAAFDALEDWWRKLPAVAKVVGLYPAEPRKRLNALQDLMAGPAGHADGFVILLDQLPALYASGPLTAAAVEVAAGAFAEDVDRLNGGEQAANWQVAAAIGAVFGGGGDLVECQQLIEQWYQNLNPTQRDPQRSEDEDATTLLKRLADQAAPFGAKLLKLLPRDYGFGAVRDWTALHMKEYAAKVKQAKAEIDKIRPIIGKPVISEATHEVGETDKIIVSLPAGAVKLIYATDGSDPRQSESAATVESDLDLVTLLRGRPSVKVKLRAVDGAGNTSDPVSVEVVSKERKYDVQIKPDLFGEPEANFKWPNDAEGLAAVLKSVIQYGVKKNLLNDAGAQRILDAVRDVLAGH